MIYFQINLGKATPQHIKLFYKKMQSCKTYYFFLSYFQIKFEQFVLNIASQSNLNEDAWRIKNQIQMYTTIKCLKN